MDGLVPRMIATRSQPEHWSIGVTGETSGPAAGLGWRNFQELDVRSV